MVDGRLFNLDGCYCPAIVCRKTTTCGLLKIDVGSISGRSWAGFRGQLSCSARCSKRSNPTAPKERLSVFLPARIPCPVAKKRDGRLRHRLSTYKALRPLCSTNQRNSRTDFYRPLRKQVSLSARGEDTRFHDHNRQYRKFNLHNSSRLSLRIHEGAGRL